MQGVVISREELKEVLELGLRMFEHAAAMRRAAEDGRCPKDEAAAEREKADRLEVAVLRRLIR